MGDAMDNVATVCDSEDMKTKVCAIIDCIDNPTVTGEAEASKCDWHVGAASEFRACALNRGWAAAGIGGFWNSSGGVNDPRARQVAGQFLQPAGGGGTINTSTGQSYTWFLTGALCTSNEFASKALAYEEIYHRTQPGYPIHPHPGNFGSPGVTSASQLDTDGLLTAASNFYMEIEAKISVLAELGQSKHTNGPHASKRDAQVVVVKGDLAVYLKEFCKYYDPAKAKIDASGGTTAQTNTMKLYARCKEAGLDSVK